MNNELIEGVDFYFNKSGLMVFTKEYHLKREYCCGNGCRHCPYHFENVTDRKNKEELMRNEKSRSK